MQPVTDWTTNNTWVVVPSPADTLKNGVKVEVWVRDGKHHGPLRLAPFFSSSALLTEFNS